MSSKKLFVREATGLVKEISLKDVVIYNALASGTIMLALSYSIAWIPAWFTGADIILAMVITSLLYIPVYLTYGLIVASFPRTSGDYVYISRILYPSLGFAASFNIWFWNVFVLSISAYWVSTLALSPALTATGLLLNNSSVVSLGNALSTPLWSFVIGTICIVLVSIAAGIGVKRMIILQNVFFIVGVIGYVILLGVMASKTHTDFVNAFNALFPSNTVSSIISSAAKAGVALPYTMSWPQTILAFSVVQGVIGWIMWSQYVSGEIKEAGRVKRQWAMFLVPWAIEALAVGIGAYLVLQTIGYDFLAAVGTSWPLQTPPYVGFFAALLSGNWVIGLIIMLSITAWILAGAFGPMMTFLTRLPFAWSFDRMFPERFATIDERFRAPVYSIIFVAIIGIIGNYLLSFYYAYFSILWAGTVAGVLIFTSIPALLAAVVFPYRRKEMYEKSPARAYQVKGVPLITLLGIPAVLIQVFLGCLYVVAPFWGFGVGGGALMLGVFVVGFVIFYAFRAYRKSKGIDVDMIFKEIPPE